MFIHRSPRHRLTRMLPAGLRVMALFALLFTAAALLEQPAGAYPVTTPPPATPHAAR